VGVTVDHHARPGREGVEAGGGAPLGPDDDVLGAGAAELLPRRCHEAVEEPRLLRPGSPRARRPARAATPGRRVDPMASSWSSIDSPRASSGRPRRSWSSAPRSTSWGAGGRTPGPARPAAPAPRGRRPRCPRGRRAGPASAPPGTRRPPSPGRRRSCCRRRAGPPPGCPTRPRGRRPGRRARRSTAGRPVRGPRPCVAPRPGAAPRPWRQCGQASTDDRAGSPPPAGHRARMRP
jgi:hypothetical protein